MQVVALNLVKNFKFNRFKIAIQHFRHALQNSREKVGGFSKPT